jgi:hypothetical protein
MVYTIYKKVRVNLKQWDEVVQMPFSYENIKAVKIRWSQYETQTSGNYEMLIRCDEFGGNGLQILDNRSTVPYFVSLPLDKAQAVSCMFSNFTAEYDQEYPEGLSFNELHFQIYINGSAATGISPSSPVLFEISLYR